ncbi:ESX secretion-associated protein EspG [Actinokineospora bangkokensis]|uniref:ESX secretion-associated protein EspG n=1 Tax=Actinokineospora bangkokensis TaxID=1193682 RepID=A0A1Q9LDM6_9PSEU|nr:ESX secretion-associated protein EspG [Actinokineospora bangkokensis]OLR90138.1 hypothetical protein BJP25_03960 [Actinokineospora bangkokensis]
MELPELDLLNPAGVALHPVEVHLLCTFAEVEAPFPLEVATASTSDEERAVLFHHAAATLIERDLADEQGPLGVAEEFAYLLGHCSGVVDLVVDRGGAGRLGVAMLVAGNDALLVTQDAADPHGALRMLAAPFDDAVSRLCRVLPTAEAPRTAPFSIPKKSAQAIFEVMVDRMPDDDGESPREPRPLTQQELDRLLADHGIDEQVLRRMTTALHPVEGSGQVGLARRSPSTEDQWQRVGDELAWVDTPKGRFRLATEDDSWISVNPLAQDDLRSAVRGLAQRAR